jgi:hypothetical protein
MKIKERQPAKRTTMTEITFTPSEALRLIEGLAAGVRAIELMDWNNYCVATFQVDDFRYARIKVEEE